MIEQNLNGYIQQQEALKLDVKRLEGDLYKKEEQIDILQKQNLQQQKQIQSNEEIINSQFGDINKLKEQKIMDIQKYQEQEQELDEKRQMIDELNDKILSLKAKKKRLQIEYEVKYIIE